MGAIQQIYEGKEYKDSKRTLGEITSDIYSDNDYLDQQKFPYRPSRHHRSAWTVSCREWLYRGIYIPLFVNPSDVQWSIPRRGTVQKTAAGAVRNSWRNRFRDTYFDEFSLNITFQTGSVMPSNAYFDQDITTYAALNEARKRPQVPPGLYNFYRFLELIDRPKLAGAYENRHIIIMHTRVFPSIRLEGYFTEEPITFAESDKDANQLTWTATFQVYRTFPKLSASRLMTSVYREFIREEALGEAIDKSRLRRLDAEGNALAAGIDNLAAIPTEGGQSSNTTSTRGAYDNLTLKGGGTRRGASTLKTKPSDGYSKETLDYMFGK